MEKVNMMSHAGIIKIYYVPMVAWGSTYVHGEQKIAKKCGWFWLIFHITGQFH